MAPVRVLPSQTQQNKERTTTKRANKQTNKQRESKQTKETNKKRGEKPRKDGSDIAAPEKLANKFTSKAADPSNKTVREISRVSVLKHQKGEHPGTQLWDRQAVLPKFSAQKEHELSCFQSIPLLINSINLKRDGVRICLGKRCGKVKYWNLSYSAIVSISCQLHWVIESKHATE